MQLRFACAMLFLNALLISIGCNKDSDIPDDVVVTPNECVDSFTSNIELEWAIPLNPDTLQDFSDHLGMVLEHVFYQSVNHKNSPYSQILADRDNGETIWKNSYTARIPSFTDGPYLLQSNFVMQSTKATYIFNSFSGAIERELDVQHVDSALGRQICVAGDKIYRVHTENISGNGRYARLVEMNTNGQVVRGLLKVHRDNINGLHPAFVSFQLFEDNNTGNQLLAFLMKGINYSTSETRVDLYAYDLDEGKMKYHYEDLTSSGSCSDRGLLINGGYAFIQGVQNIYCYELESGNRLWETAIQDLSSGSNMVYTQGTLVVNPESELLVGIHPNNGNKKWQLGFAGGNFDFSDPTTMLSHNGHVFFGSRTNDRLSCVSVNSSTANVIWNDYSPLALIRDPCKAGFNTPLTIDEQGGMLYANDNYFLMGIKLPD